MICRFFFALLLGMTSALAVELPTPKDRVLILGDSITYVAHYVAIIEAALLQAHPQQHYTVISCGLSSETVSGLSEAGHADGKFPRPTLHERLDRVLAAVKPTYVLACYGMNCGIYLPLSEERFAAYRKGRELLHDKVLACGAKMLHLTPPVFDPLPLANKVTADGVGGPFRGYDDVLKAYSEWLLEMREKRAWQVLDVHGAMTAALAKARETEPGFTFAKDGVHPNEEGHAIMAAPVLTAWGLPTPRAALVKAVMPKVEVLRSAWLTKAGHQRPGVRPGLPLEEAEAKALELDSKARAIVE